MSKLKCETCRYWDQFKNYPGTGQCRAGLPDIDRSDCRGIWPETRADDWCGQHEEPLGEITADDVAGLLQTTLDQSGKFSLPVVEKEVKTGPPVSLEDFQDFQEYRRHQAAADAERLRDMVDGRARFEAEYMCEWPTPTAEDIKEYKAKREDAIQRYLAKQRAQAQRDYDQMTENIREGRHPAEGPHTQHPGNKKPPLGVLPLRLWQESNPNPDLATIAKRHIDVCNAVIRYHQAGIHVPPQWLREMGIIVETTRDPGQTTGGDGQETTGEK